MDVNKLWQIYPKLSAEQRAELSSFPQLVAQLLVNRSLDSKKQAGDFFSADWEMSLLDPFAFAQMKDACELIIKHLKDKSLIAIAGDYDADGVTSSALLNRIITALGGKAEVWIPSRLGEGYGLSKKIVDDVIAAGAKLLITVDNGIKAGKEIAYAQSKGIDTIVTDHHMGPDDAADLPAGVVLDAVVEGETYPFKYLAGVGVAYKLAAGLIQMSTLNSGQKEKLVSADLDLVALGTVADCVPLVGENRALVKRGLAMLNKQTKPGVRALITAASAKGEIDEASIGWQLAPRLNVAGRMEHANVSYRLLMTEDQKEADELANKLNDKNALRQAETARIVEYCEKMIEAGLKNDKILILVSPDLEYGLDDKWLEGVIGLVAGRLCEKYSKPALVICLSEGQIKGSGRSIESVNVVDFLANFSDYLSRYGGHKMACGFSVKNKDVLMEFVGKARELAAATINDTDLIPRLKIDAEVELADVNGELADWLTRFSPFGQANPIPLFVSRGVRVMDFMPLGMEAQHFKLRFGSVWAIAFNATKRWPTVALGSTLDIAYHLEWNEYNGFRNLQMRIVDIHVV